MLKINHFVSKKSQLCYCDLKPGDVFYFANDPNRIPNLKLKDVSTFGGSLPKFIALSDPWEVSTCLIVSEVYLLNAELNVSEIY